jgi:hypothetical protein
MEGRMTVCNMTIEAGARAGLIAPDEKTYAYFKGRPRAPKGKAWDMAVEYWKTLPSDEGAHYDKIVRLDAAALPPIVSWGSSPEDVIAVTGAVPNPDDIKDEAKRTSKWRALDYMGLKPGTPITDIDRPGLHRLVHQWPDRGSARGGQGGRGQDRQCQCRCDDRSGLGPGQGTGGSRGSGQDLQGCGLSTGASRAARCALP